MKLTTLMASFGLVSFSLAMPAASLAQDDDSADDEDEVIEQIIVTGSRIKRDTTFN